MIVFLMLLSLGGCKFSGSVEPLVECTASCDDNQASCYDTCETECVDANGDGDEACDTDCKTTCDDAYETCSVDCDNTDG